MLDKIYIDFTDKVLPKVAKGFSITKEYFIELFGRYIHYLIVTDTIKCIFYILLCIPLAILTKTVISKIFKLDIDYDELFPWVAAIFFLIIIDIVVICSAYSKLEDVFKGIYIPEVRVYEQINLKQINK